MNLATEWLREARMLHSRETPAFVRGGPAEDDAGYLPVFCFHTLVPERFEAQLRFLSANRYRSVTLDDAVRWMRGEIALPERAVVLTIDDGRLSTFRVGLPLLQRFDACATAFVIPGLLEDGPPRATLDDPQEGRARQSEIASSERADAATALRWSELERLHASGRVSIESHTWLHRRIGVAAEVVDFLTPQHADGMRYEIPLDAGAVEGWSRTRIEACLGTPLLASASLLVAERECRVPDEEIERVRERVRREGGAGFFDARGRWRRALAEERVRCARTVQRVDPIPHRADELLRAKRVLEERLPGKCVRHLCLPRGDGGADSARLAAATGHESMSWGTLPASSSNRRGADPLRLARVKHDFIERLPGDGRVSLLEVLRRKLARRLVGERGW
jgi:hypothetical protein